MCEDRSQHVLWCLRGQVLGAGQYNGQFAVFDVRQGADAVDATPIERSHRYPSDSSS